MAHVHLPHLDDEEEPAAEPAAEASPPSAAEPSPDPAPASSPPVARNGHQRSSWLLKIGLEVLLISVGVFLALLGEQWRENAHTRELATTSLRLFRAEIVTNRQAVLAVKDYHVVTLKSLETYFAAEPKARQISSVEIKGVQPASFERTAWDLALATQALTHIDAHIAFALSRIYGLQQAYADLTRGILNAMYLRPPTEDARGFMAAVTIYYGDIVLYEPELLRQYDEVVQEIDRALGESSGRATTAK
jgi:hypothetical protein